MSYTEHHQLAEIAQLVGVHRLTMFWGARGTGKSSLLVDLGRILDKNHVIIHLKASDARSLEELNRPLANELGCLPDALDARGYEGRPLVVLLDQCERLFDESWVGAFQDEWRALFTAPESSGKLSCVLASRPRFRDTLGGFGSPLANAARHVRARPLTVDEIKTRFGCSPSLAAALRSKTGGHPWLTKCASSASSVGELVAALPSLVDGNAGYILRLIDDHDPATRGLISDLVDSDRGMTERVLLDRHFRGRADAGLDVIDDLVGSGLLGKPTTSTVVVNAELLRGESGLRRLLVARRARIGTQASSLQQEAYNLIYQVENHLRDAVLSTRSDLSRDWWENAVAREMVAKAEGRRDAEREGCVGTTDDVHPIAYLDLGEVADLAMAEPGWSQAFTHAFGMNSAEFRATVTRLLVVRNMVAHTRPVAARDVEALRAAADQLRPSP